MAKTNFWPQRRIYLQIIRNFAYIFHAYASPSCALGIDRLTHANCQTAERWNPLEKQHAKLFGTIFSIASGLSNMSIAQREIVKCCLRRFQLNATEFLPFKQFRSAFYGRSSHFIKLQ